MHYVVKYEPREIPLLIVPIQPQLARSKPRMIYLLPHYNLSIPYQQTIHQSILQAFINHTINLYPFQQKESHPISVSVIGIAGFSALRRINLKLSKFRDYMATKPENSQKTVYVEYCRSCDTHSWCTHHDETKYHETFLKLSELIAERFPEIEVIGNMVPPHLIPFKISENKYIDSQTNKYVVYPQIGSFQVRFNNVTLYSKKDNNAWPNMSSILSKVASLIDPNYKSPSKAEKPTNSSKKDTEITVEKEAQNGRFMKSEDEKVTVHKDQSKGFTLTDHFKLYRPKTKHEDKDWLTEKPDSQGSLKQFSQQIYRGDSRQKSEKSDDSKRRRDFNGQTKLKQMLKSRGLMLKQQGKKEMIIKLDSIEQENANYEDGNGATQRTQEISNKKNKMQQLEDEFSSLQNRFNSFENKVHDIHTKNRQFEYKQEASNEHSRFKNVQNKNEESTRKESKKQQGSQKENFYFYERASKLDEYLNASEEEKNQKLHKIYGEWKYLKQTAQKNKKLLKNKGRNSQEPDSSDQESQTHSNSPSYIANVITFKPKKDRSTPKLVGKNMSKERGHKYSTIEKYDSNKLIVPEPKFKSGEQFYKRGGKNQQHVSIQSEQEVHTSSKLLRKGLGTMSMQALKKYASKEALVNQQRPQREEEISEFSESAQNNIRQIQSRIANIQNKLKAQKEGQDTTYFSKPTLQALKNVYTNNKSRSQSQASNYSARNQSKRQVQNKGKNNDNLHRNSYRHPNNKNFRNLAKNKADNKGKSRISQANQFKKQKEGVSHSEAIEEESELVESNYLSGREQKIVENGNVAKNNRSANKKGSSNKHKQQNNQRGNRESTSYLRSAALGKNQEKLKKSDSHNVFNVTQPKKMKVNKHSNQDDQRISKIESDATQNNEHFYERTQQQQSRVHEHPLHDQLTFLRKKKEWRESQPVKKSQKGRQLRSSQQDQISRSYEQEDNPVEQSQQRSKLNESKQTVSKVKNQMRSAQRQNSDTPKKSKTKQSEQADFGEQRQQSQFGRIRKNRSRQHDVMRSTEKQSEDRERWTQEMRDGNDENEENEEVERYRDEDQVEGEEEQNQSESAQNQEGESDPSVMQSSHPESRTNEEQESRPVQKMLSKSQKQQIKRANRKQNLSYYKSTQVCYQGDKKQQTEQNNSSSLHSDKPREDTLQRKISLPAQNNSGKSIQNGVSGWKLHSQEEGESDPIMMDREEESAKTQEEGEVEEQENSKLRNSLDLELENDEQQLGVLKQQQKQVEKAVNNQQIQQEIKMQQSPNRVNNGNQQTKPSQQKGQQLQEQQKQEEQTNVASKSAKTKQKQSKKAANNKVQPSIEKQVNIEDFISQQYTTYLADKLTEVIAKQNSKEQIAKLQTTQAKQYQDCEIAINLINCPSISSIASRQSIPASFMDYQPPVTTLVQHQQQEQVGQEQENVENQSEQVQEKQHKQEQAAEDQKVAMNKSQSQGKEVEKNVDGVNQTVIAKIDSPIAGQQPSTTQKQTLQHPQSANIQSANPLKQQLQNTPQLALVQTNKSKQPNTPTKSAQSPLLQQNNVYSQAKQASKFKQIGIQKELTLQVSVQTDQPPQDLTADLFMARNNSAKSSQIYKPPTSRQSHKRKAEMEESIFQEANPVKNNYFSQSKGENMLHKKKPLKQMQRAHIIEKIYSPTVQSQARKFANIVSGADQDIHREQGAVLKMLQCYKQGELFSTKGIEPQLIQTKFTRLLKVVEILCEKSQWLITRLFEDKNGLLKDKVFGVWLCRQYQWESFIVDDSLRVNQDNHPLYSLHTGNQMWFNVLEKAVALALGGYDNLIKAQTNELFTLLTGCNSIVSKIKQDPTKNNKLLLLINDCLRKNYVIHAEKSDKSKKEQTKENVYYINSIRKAGGDEETLIQLSQNGRESFWIKLSRFVQEFCRIEILQLRINHNFTHLDLGVGRPGQLTVVQLQFEEDAQGCVTLSYLGESGALRAFLYRQQKNKVLKLIGQAKQKNKSHLFFECSFTEGKYYVFAQAEERPSRLAFLGESHPHLTITEQIHTQGLKNQMAEYLPVRQTEQTRMKHSQLDSQTQFRGRMPHLHNNFMQSRLRQNFIEYVLGKSKR